MKLKLSVLDQSPIRSGGTAADAVRETLLLAQAAERLGYHRYWVAEHHSAASFASSSPEVLVAGVASATSGIRVGSGGVMLMHYSPLKVAENFRMLETLFPGRIDLGVGRAAGADPRTARALQAAGGEPTLERFPSQVADLLTYLHDAPPQGHPHRRTHAAPECEGAPELWLLGSSGSSAQLASQLGCAYSFAQFIQGADGAAAVRAYRQQFQPSAHLAEPRASAAIFVICAETEDEARRLASSVELWRRRMERGVEAPFASVEEARAHAYSEAELLRLTRDRERMVVGDVAQVRGRLLGVAEHYGVEELLLVTITHDFESRLRSYELIARAFGMEGRDG
ncbi:MAG: LLM class flavin-dependent oxidoreductase [Pyrinomonadaceae bacterium]